MTAFEQTPETQAAIVATLQPIYAALVREFVIEVPDNPAPCSIDKATNWLLRVDAEMQVHQLRQFLQSTPLASEPVLRCLLLHHLQKTVKSNADRDKIDFLLVQYFSFCAPTAAGETEADFQFVAQVLEPILGEQHVVDSKWAEPLQQCILAASRCTCLSDLLHCGSIEHGRKIKSAAGEGYYEPAAMVTFARFSYAIRRVFFRLIQHDLNTIQDGLCELERRGITSVDCRCAQFSAEESTSRLRMICQSWKVMFHAEYSSGHPLRMLVDLRAAVENALDGSCQPAEQKHSVIAHAAAASNSSNSGKAD
jgi:hypothetical protein